MTCQEALSLLYDIIDKEASEVDTKEVEAHLNKCHHCFETFKLERDIHNLISAKLNDDEPERELSALKTKVLGRLDQLDSKEASADGRRPFPSNVAGRILAAAASLIILLGAGYYGNRLLDHQNNFIPLEEAHWNVSDIAIQVASSNETVTFVNALREEYGYSPASLVNGFALMGGHIDTVEGVQMRHLIYSDGERMVSVFLAPANDYHIPQELVDNPVVRDHVKFFDHNCRGCRLVYHQVGDIVVITATSNRDVDLLEFNPAAGTI